MPCVEMMMQMNLYCSEIRGVIKTTSEDMAAVNIDHENCIHGLFVRRDILNNYLKLNDYVMFYYVLGEKQLNIGGPNVIIKNISAAYQYCSEDKLVIVQPMRVV